MNVPMNRSASGRITSAAVRGPRWVMSWEDWLTFAAAMIAFLAVGVSIQQARWVPGMPSTIPTLVLGLAFGMLAARIRYTYGAIHVVMLLLGILVIALAVQSYAEGGSIAERLSDTRLRLADWWAVVRANEISNDRLPFIVLVHAICFLAAYLSAFTIYRWHNPWVAIVPGGAVLLANIALQRGHPTGAFLVFLFGAMVLIARLNLQRLQARWKRLGIEYPEFISLSAGQLTLILVGGLLIAAWLLPSAQQAGQVTAVYDAAAGPFTGHSGVFARLFSTVDARKGGRLHNFGDFLTVRGNVKLGTRPLYEVKATEPGFLRGQSYEFYTGAGWKQGKRDGVRVEGGGLAAVPGAETYQARQETVLQVTVLDGDNTVLSSGVPLGTNRTITAESPRGFRGDIEQLSTNRGLSQGETYNSVGSRSKATEGQLRGAGTAYPDWVNERYLQLPKSLPSRVRDESARVAGSAATPYDRAKAVEDYLRTFPYDLQVPATPAGRDITDFLLFDLRRGYFDYQATAMTVMLRTLGIPARIAVGYVLDPNEVVETTYTVRKDDAYSWVEVYFPKYGWVAFNPTADRPAGGVTGGLGAAVAPNDPLAPDGLEDLLSNSGTVLSPGAQEALNANAVVNDPPPWALIWSLVGVLVLFTLIAFSGRLAWGWGLGGLVGPVRLWAQAQRVAGWARLGGSKAETAREWSSRVGGTVARPAEASRLAAAYEESRYGRPDLQRTDPEQAAVAYRGLRNTLLKYMVRRRLPARDR